MMAHTTDRTRANQPAPHVPPVDRRTNGHAAFAVQAAEQTRERAEQLADAGARRHPDGACRTYAWCDESGPHYDHSRHYDGLVSYGVTHLSGSQRTLYVEENDFTPDEAAVKAAELRVIADLIEAMQHKVTPAAPAPVTWQQLSNRLIEAGIDLFKLAQQDGDPQLRAGYEALQYVIGLVDERAMEECA
ncbi:hypothetical protein ACWCQN_39890 [Streptomyces sp. NPDC001984]|uniref:hypothetical protein n=1 Tax=Streptomyces sp. NPDC002619 TaxID=3364655 RepID=UPI003675AA33